MEAMTFEEAVKSYEESRKKFDDFKSSHSSSRILGIFKRIIPDKAFEELGKLEKEMYDIHMQSHSLESNS